MDVAYDSFFIFLVTMPRVTALEFLVFVLFSYGDAHFEHVSFN